VDTPKHAVVTAVHPSGLSAHRGFLGSRCFVAVNRALAARGRPPLPWRV
jgi:uracil-DNA glycosylase